MFAGLFIAELYMQYNHEVEVTRLLGAASPMAILLSVMLASRQFVYNAEWNKKEAARASLGVFVKKYNSIIESLHPVLNLREKIRNRDVIPIQDIHNIMGVFIRDGSGYRFVYHGTQTQEDIKHIHTQVTSGYATSFRNDINGMVVERSIIALLNEFEYIAAFMKNETLDAEIVIKLLGSTILNSYIIFEPYIHHLRNDCRHGGDSDTRNGVYEQFEDMAKSIAIELKDDHAFNKINEKKTKTPFGR